MAVVAVVARWYVIGRLAGCEDAIVARAATSDDIGVVDECHRAPGGCGMARRAYLRRGYVIHGFDRCSDRAKLRMTPYADRGRPFERTTGMATFT